MDNENEKKAKGFPYKTLIWASLALVAMFLFKTEFKDLLSKADEVSLFGIELKVGKEKAEELEKAITKYKDQITAFNEQMTEQQDHIQKLETLKQGLEEDLAACPSASEKAMMWNREFEMVKDGNIKLQERSEILKNTKIWQKASLVQQPVINQ